MVVLLQTETNAVCKIFYLHPDCSWI